MAIFGCIVLALIGFVIVFSGIAMGLVGSAFSGLKFGEGFIVFLMIAFGVFLIFLSGHFMPIQIVMT